MRINRFGYQLGRKYPALAGCAGVIFTIVFGWVAHGSVMSGEFTSKRVETDFANEPAKFIFMVSIFYVLAAVCAVTAVFNFWLAWRLRYLRHLRPLR